MWNDGLGGCARKGEYMTFDEAYKREALELFDRQARLEITQDGEWVPLFNEPLRFLMFEDRSRACELASLQGLRLSNGERVRFEIKTPNVKVTGAPPNGA